MRIKIDAIDTLFFKDGKPFSMGDETWADGIFPPPPSVIYGALRTAYFGEHPEDFSKVNTDEDPTKSLCIKGINFYDGIADYFPLPLDLVKKKNDEDDKAYLMKMNKTVPLSSSSFSENVLSPEFNDEVETVEAGMIASSGLERYLKGIEENTIYSTLSTYIQSEPKVGIARDNFTHTSSEGKLYRVGMRRLAQKKEFNKVSNNLSIIVDYEGIELPEKGFIKFGAEGKIASYKVVNGKKLNIDFDEVNSTKENYFKLYLLTPALFKNGWEPDVMSNPLLSELGLVLISGCIGKPQNFGGFDMQKKMPKPMRKAVPAGSVYYFKSEAKNFNEKVDKLNGNSISDFQALEGFGIALVGRIL